jgi:type I restriction-modification system DNA methylase subunit
MNVEADPKEPEPTDADFDRLQNELEDVGSELAELKQKAQQLLDAAMGNRTVSPGFGDQEEPAVSSA